MIYALHYLIGDEWRIWPTVFQTETEAEWKGLELTGDSSDFYVKGEAA